MCLGVFKHILSGRWNSRMDTKNYTQVLIDGKIYTLGGTEDEAYLQKAASYVNEKIATMHAIPGFSKQSADYQQLMLLLNIADDYFKAKENADQMEEQKDRMEKETYSLKHELVSTQMKLDGVLRDLEERQRQLQELSAKLSKTERELRAAKKQAAQALDSGNEENEVPHQGPAPAVHPKERGIQIPGEQRQEGDPLLPPRRAL